MQRLCMLQHEGVAWPVTLLLLCCIMVLVLDTIHVYVTASDDHQIWQSGFLLWGQPIRSNTVCDALRLAAQLAYGLHRRCHGGGARCNARVASSDGASHDCAMTTTTCRSTPATAWLVSLHDDA